MEPKPVIAVDVDGVVADLHTEWLRLYNEEYQDDLTSAEIIAWDLHQFVKPECGKKIYEYFSRPGFYEGVPLVPGAKEGIAHLRSMGWRVVFVTSNVKGMTDQKWDWLERHEFLPPVTVDVRSVSDYIVANDKSLVRAAFLIDDAPHNLLGKDHHGRFKGTKILFTQPWNNAVDLRGLPVLRMNGWADIIDMFTPRGDDFYDTE